MNKLLSLSMLLGMLLFSQSLIAASVADSGMKPLSDFPGYDNSGITDVSDVLNTAISWCVTNNKTLYLPSGTYRISKQIVGLAAPGQTSSPHDCTGSVVIIGDAVDRPILKLVDNSSGFNAVTTLSTDTNISTLKPLLLIKGDRAQANSVFNCGIANLVIDLGNNSSAAGVSFDSAQDCFVRHVKVTGAQFAAGFIGNPGRNAVNLNLEVIGGQLGVYCGTVGGTFVGLTLHNQSFAGMWIPGWRGNALTGIAITNCAGVGIYTDGGNTGEAGQIYITDALIELTNPAKPAIDNVSADNVPSSVILRNVYVKGAPTIVASPAWAPAYTSHYHIKTYASTPSTYSLTLGGITKNTPAYNFIDGVKSTAAVVDGAAVTSAPSNLVSRNIPSAIYEFKTAGAFNVVDSGATPGAVWTDFVRNIIDTGADDTDAIQNAIDNHTIVYLPSGNYNISRPIRLRANSVIIGDPNKRSWLTPRNWATTPTASVFLLESFDGSGKAVVQDIGFNLNPYADFMGAIHWRTSQGWIMNVRAGFKAWTNEKNRNDYLFSGAAGGAVYGINHHLQQGSDVPSPNFRKVAVRNTTNPLTFYGLNLEHGGVSGSRIQYPFFEAVGASNVRIFGMKTETDGIVVQWTQCRNVMASALIAHNHPPKWSSHVVSITNSSQVEMGIVYCYNDVNNGIAIDDSWDVIKRQDFVNLYRIGSFSHDPWDRSNQANGAGDVNGDGVVNASDFATVAAKFGLTASSPDWVASVDANADGVINATDFSVVAFNFGKVY